MSELKGEGLLAFYLNRINQAMTGSFAQREEWLHMIARTAFWDSWLTLEEYCIIINKVQDAHKIAMEENYNAGWNE